MKDIKKIFNSQGDNKSLFSIKELIFFCFIFSLLSSIITGTIIYTNKKDLLLEDKEINDIVDTYHKIKNEYYQNINNQDLATSAIDGMMAYLNETYSVYMNEDDTNSLLEKLKGDYEGLGISIMKYPSGNISIVTVYDNTPASKSGLKSGDIIKQINDLKVLEDTTTEELIEIIQNNKEISLVVLRDKENLTFNIKKEKIDYPVVETKTFNREDKKIGYLSLTSFSSNADKQVGNALNKLESDNIDSLIIDLRGNTGGYLNTATNIANKFLKKGKIIYSLESKNKTNVVYDTTKEARTYDIVILVDSRTASASEVLASSLKECYGAILIGTKTYGKGKVQQTSNLSNDTMIKYTTAKWFTPTGDNIDSIGLTPNITIELTKKYALNPNDENDDQLQKALSLLAKR